MKHYTGAHAAFFEAALSDLPTPILEWLAEDLPHLEDMVPHNSGGMLIKDSREWMELSHKAMDEILPDWCFVCGVTHGELPGGQIRDGCPACIDILDPERDSYFTPMLRITWTLSEFTDNKYFSELIEYLLCCHIKWRDSPQWNPKVLEKEPIHIKPSLRDKLRP